jgi:cyclopropane fatty-acyl-phospholipid synthase-like methyltransferase
VTGLDVDRSKIQLARQAAGAAGVADRVHFEVVDPTADAALPHIPGGWDGISCIDVLYLLGEGRAAALVREMTATLAAGGVVVLKEMAAEPKWKARWNQAQERLAVDLLRYTEGDVVEPVSLAALAEWLEDEGLQVRTRRLDRGWPHPHAAVIGSLARS